MNPNPPPQEKKCFNCGGDIAIRNPTGKCDHLYYPENVPPKKEIECLKDCKWECSMSEFNHDCDCHVPKEETGCCAAPNATWHKIGDRDCRCSCHSKDDFTSAIREAEERGYKAGVAEWYKDEEYERGRREEGNKILDELLRLGIDKDRWRKLHDFIRATLSDSTGEV